MNRRTFIILLTFLLTTLLSFAQPKREVRAVWLTTIGGLDWPHCYSQHIGSMQRQKQELTNILDKLQKAGINTVLLQTRVRGTMIYPSKYEPWDGCLSGFPGKSPGYDALEFAIDECHKRGMELHAWVVTIPVGKWNSLGCKRLRQKFPGLIRNIADEGYMNPEMPETAEYLATLCKEITEKYDIDGINLDYIRYPETWKIKVSGNQGRRYITKIVEAISSEVKSIKPWVKMSCSPIGKADDLTRYWSHGWNAYSTVLQDAQGWMKNGLMDELFPMMYFKENNFYPFAIDWKELSDNKIICPGLGIYFMSPSEKDWSLDDITREMEITRQYGMGHAYFRSKFFTDNTKGIYDFATNGFDIAPALVPAMTWIDSISPKPPTGITQSDGVLLWNKEMNITYNIYSSKTWPVDISKSENLMLARQETNNINIPTNDDRYYAITAMDRYGNESEAVQSATKVCNTAKFISNDGEKAMLPAWYNECDGMIIATGLNGNTIKTLRTKSNTIDIRSLKDGMYQIRIINKKDISHRIGFIKIKRF
ncbi:MAG: family 10 glycosylhydrolase [Prevotella sp.]|nr:family 10 glycosylhydrolase [Prevotella sp.]